MNTDHETWDDKYTRQRREEIDLAITQQRELLIMAQDREAELTKADYRERTIEQRAYSKAENDERDRRVTWWCAVTGAAANPNCLDAATAAEYADHILAEYEKRWPDVGV